MTDAESTPGVLRAEDGSGRSVTNMELFFDLVYVFAITQLSHLLLRHLTWHGAAQTLLLMLAVWWAWIYTAWFTNWFDPDRRPVRAVLISGMAAGLIMAAALPRAFGDRGLVFAACYVVFQCGRDLYAWSSVRTDGPLRRNLLRVLAWAVFSGIFWIAGGFAHGTARELLWLGGVLADYSGPYFRFLTPGLGRSELTDWSIDGGHLAERCHLVVIIALGESVLVTGATFSDLPYSPGPVTAVIVALLGSVALWWLYFDRAAEAGRRRIGTAAVPGPLARDAYNQLHLPIVAGIIVTAVGDEIVISHPGGHASWAATVVIVGGPALFLAGHTLFKYAIFQHLSPPRFIGLAVLGLLSTITPVVTPLVLATGTTLTIAGVCLAEDRTAHA